MNYRDFLQKVIYVIINPIIKGMIKIGITPNFITTTGFVLNLVATAMFIYAAEVAETDAFAWIDDRLILCTHRSDLRTYTHT